MRCVMILTCKLLHFGVEKTHDNPADRWAIGIYILVTLADQR